MARVERLASRSVPRRRKAWREGGTQALLSRAVLFGYHRVAPSERP
ncbi:hypothetical protein [Nonomuraea sp. KM88]